jgi:flavin reductase (DIM6/NTAB) family NADH-FMN oxidoreductase RutF
MIKDTSRHEHKESQMYKEVRGKEAMGYLPTKPTMIITTRHASGVVNAGVFGAYTNLSGTQVGIAVARDSHTYANVLRGGEFVINVPGADIVKTLAIIAGKIPETRSELEEAGLTCKAGIALETPSIAECQAAAEFEFDKELSIGVHSFMIGQVVGGWIRESAMDEDGKIDIFKARVMKDFKYPEPLYVLPGEIVEG